MHMTDKEKVAKETMTYEAAGVSIDAGDHAVELIRDMVKSTYNERVIGDIGGFAGFFNGAFPEMDQPLLVSSTDGVGTKLLPAIKTGIVNTVGIDLVAMCANDIICCGGKPLFFLDYIACGHNEPERMSQIIEGIVNGCKQAGCALVGGEMAEMPDMYGYDDFDLAGFCVGVVDRKNVIDGSKVSEGDVLIGLKSAGIHSNGYSLVRKIIESKGFDIKGEASPLPGRLIDYILEPTKIYVKEILDLMASFEIHGVVHITGGGITGNVPRVLGDGLSAEVDRSSWSPLNIFGALQEWGNVADDEMYRVFNMGIGMIVIMPQNQAKDAVSHLEKMNAPAMNIGRIIKGDSSVVYK
jgi:phosphoribosylformylglycinamidine cyclo-ligase